MRHGLRNFLDNTRAVILAILVHVVIFALMGMNLNWNRPIKPATLQPILAVAVDEPLIPKIKPEPIKELVPEPIPEAQPEPEPEPEPIKQEFTYSCAGKEHTVNDKEEANALQKECEDDERKKKELAKIKRHEEAQKRKKSEEKAKQEALAAKKKREKEQKEKKLAKEKRIAKEAKQKELAEKKRKAQEQKKKELAEKKRKEREAEKKRVAASKKAAADAKRQKQAAQAAKMEGERIVGEAATALGLAVGRISAAVASSWIQPRIATIGLEAVVRVNVGPGGEVMSARVVRSSGNPLFDRSAEIAIQKASPLPIPTNSSYYPHIKEFDFRFKPNG